MGAQQVATFGTSRTIEAESCRFVDLAALVAVSKYPEMVAGLEMPPAARDDLLYGLRKGFYCAVSLTDITGRHGYFIWERRLGAFQFVLINMPPRPAGWTRQIIEHYAIPTARAQHCWGVVADVERAGMTRKLEALGFQGNQRLTLEL